MKTVAVTGGIGSGKSTVCSILAERGIPVYDSDSSAKRLYVTDDALLDSIEEAFGCSVRSKGGSADLRKIASLVFSSPEKLRILESIVHPAVLKDFRRWNALQASRFEGQVMPVLVEERNRQEADLMTGRTPHNLVVHFPAGEDLIGRIVDVRLTESRGFYYMGERV